MKIIVDTREQTPWDFTIHGIVAEIDTVKTGDYTLVGYEDVVAIERKASPSELATNLGSGIKRFEKEMVRISEFKYKYVICEFTLDEMLKFPKGAKIPKRLKRRIRMNGQYMHKKIGELELEYGVIFIFAGNKPQAVTAALEIFEEVVEDAIDHF